MSIDLRSHGKGARPSTPFITRCLPKHRIRLCWELAAAQRQIACPEARADGGLCPSGPAQGVHELNPALSFSLPPRQRHRPPPPNRKSVPRGPAGSGLHGLPEKAGTAASLPPAPAAPLPPRTVWNTQHPAATRHVSTEPRGGGRRLEPPNPGAACTAEPAGLLVVFVTTEVKQMLCHQASARLPRRGPSHARRHLGLRGRSSRVRAFFGSRES